MDVRQLIDAVNNDMEEEYGDAQILDWINRGYLVLSDIVKPEKKQIIYYTTTLTGYIEIKAVVSESGFPLPVLELHDMDSVGYSMIGNTIELRNVDELVYLYYYSELDPLVNLTDTPNIPVQFHDMLIHYAVANMQFTEEEFQNRPDRMKGYNSRIADLQRYYERKRAKNNAVTVDSIYKAVW